MYRTATNERDFGSILTAVNRMVRCLTRCADDADDIAQEVMIKLLTSQAVPSEIGPSWLFKVSQNCVRDARRRMASEYKYVNYDLVVDQTGAVCERNAEERVVYCPVVSARQHELEPDVKDALIKAVANLPISLRDALVMHADGYSYSQIATLTRANIGTVRSRLHHGRKRVRKLLAKLA